MPALRPRLLSLPDLKTRSFPLYCPLASSKLLQRSHRHRQADTIDRRVFVYHGPPRPSLHVTRLPVLTATWTSRDIRCFSTASLVIYLTPPAVFIGLVLTLWAYKCLMMIIFQNKIIYMPSVPPFSRSEKIEDYAKTCHGVQWREERIQSTDGTRLALAVGDCHYMGKASRSEQATGSCHLTIVYFQGNASSLPPRLPMLSSVLRTICSGPQPISATLVAVSYRGFWKSAGRATQAGIEKDAEAAILWTNGSQSDVNRETSARKGAKLVLWGQSIGAGVATQAAAKLPKGCLKSSPRIDGMILETPFTSVRAMLVGLYPQKYLPYRYLWPFLRSSWDSTQALQEIHKQQRPPKLLILNAEKDEVVPHEHGEVLVGLAESSRYDIKHTSVKGALHHEATTKQEGRRAVAEFCQSLTR